MLHNIHQRIRDALPVIGTAKQARKCRLRKRRGCFTTLLPPPPPPPPVEVRGSTENPIKSSMVDMVMVNAVLSPASAPQFMKA